MADSGPAKKTPKTENPSRRRRIEDITGPPPGVPSAIFGPDDDNVIPGEVIVALEADAAATIAGSIPSLPHRGAAANSTITAIGADPVDQALADLNVISVTRVHGPSPAPPVNGIAMASDLGLDTTLRIRYAATEAPGAVAERLAGLAEVAWAEPNRWREASIVPNDPQFASQWGLTQIQCPDAWDLTTGDPSIVVAVVDTGVDLNHPELAPLLVAGQDLVDFPPGSIPQPGWVFEGDYTGVDNVPQDEVGHGTHVAGTICCSSNNSAGVAGVAWNVRLMPVRVLARIRNTTTNQVSGSGSAANIAAGIRWATDNGARVINMSLGGYGDTTVEREAVAYAISRGVVVCAAMANDNSPNPSYPAAYPDVISVAATDSANKRASFSNFGNWCDISGPGVGIVSTYWDDTYATLSGTSMATPHVAGVAALVLSRNTALTAAQVGNILRTTALPLRDNPGDPVPNDYYGYGLVQAAAAVRAARPPQKSLQLICPSFSVRCPSGPVICTSFQISCSSTQITCRSIQVTCVPSAQISCPSLVTICPTTTILCHATNAFTCQQSLPNCPSLVCPSLACQGGPGDPGQQSTATDWSSYDPYGYDPYANDYT